MKDITNRIRNNVFSHIKPHFDVVRGLRIAVLSTPILLLSAGCSTQLGNERHAQHGADQIKMIAIQREARLQEKQAQADANAALVQALAEVAKAAPDQAGSVAVALAVIGVRGASTESQDAPTVTLQRQTDTGIEWAKALAPTVGNLVSGLGVAAINANIQKNASDNNRDVMLGDQQQNARIVEAVAGLGTSAVANSGMSVGGSYYDMEGESQVDNSTNSSASQDTTTTNTTEISADTTIDYQGQGLTLADLISQLQSAGATYSIDLDGDGTPDVSGGDGELDTDLSCTPTFDGPPC